MADYGRRFPLRMTVARSSPPCSQTCRYSCHWTTPACASLSLLTWGCPCVAWRFSTNHWPLSSTTSRLLTPNNLLTPTTTSSSPPCPSHFLWHFLCVAGWSSDSSFSFSAQTASSLHPSISQEFTPSPCSPPGLWEGSVSLPHFFSLNKYCHLHVFSLFVSLVLSFYF